jgi:arabinofuranosyltransferase
VLFLVLVTLLFANRFINFKTAPFENAAILLRYAEHFTQGHRIVWNAGEEPVDGATTFLLMIIAGSFVKLGLTTEPSVRMIG